MTWWREQWWLIPFAILTIPVVAAAVFAWWIQRRRNIDLEKGAKCWDAFVKLGSEFTVIVMGCNAWEFPVHKRCIRTGKALLAGCAPNSEPAPWRN